MRAHHETFRADVATLAIGIVGWPRNPDPLPLYGGGLGWGLPRYLPASIFAAVSVFTSSIAIVMGPTPPGTGVIAEATSDTAS